MEIILIQDVDRLGSKDDLVTVKDGFARNYLIPRKKPLPPLSRLKKYLLKMSGSVLTRKPACGRKRSQLLKNLKIKL